MGHADGLPKEETQNNYLIIGFSCRRKDKQHNNAATTSSDNLLLQYRANVN